MGKSTISMAMFNSYVKLPEGIGKMSESDMSKCSRPSSRSSRYQIPLQSKKKSAEKEMTYILYPIKNWEKSARRLSSGNQNS
jgi:Tfp pilus assembly protein PilX